MSRSRTHAPQDLPAAFPPGADRPQEPRPAAGQEPRTEAAAPRALDSRGLRTVLCDLLGRPPFPAEAERWIGKSLYALLDDVLGSEPFWRHWWEEQLYYFLLVDEFRPETETARSAPRKLAEGRLNAREALHRIALTPTFDLRNPGADTFVTVVMEQFCGITVQSEGRRELEIGKQAYDGGSGRFLGKSASNQSDVIRICVEHRRADEHFLRREYRRLLWRDPDPKELKGWSSAFRRDPFEFPALLRAWLVSDAYAARLREAHPKSNRLFVRGLFVDLVQELPGDDELEALRTALDGLADPRPLRGVVARMLLDSGMAPMPDEKRLEDASEWVSGRFEALLGRPPAPEELRTFTETLARPDCTPSTVVYALVTSREYHSY